MAKIKWKSRFCGSSLALFQSKFLTPMPLFVCLSVSKSELTQWHFITMHISWRRLVPEPHLVLFSVLLAVVRLHWVWPTMWFGWLNWGSWIWCKQRLENSPACVHFSLTPATTIRCQARLSGGGGDTNREQRPCKSGQLPRAAQTASDAWESSDQQNGQSRDSEWLLQNTTKIWGSQSPS